MCLDGKEATVYSSEARGAQGELMSQDYESFLDDLNALLENQEHAVEELAALDQDLAERPDDVLAWRKKGYIQATLHRYEEALRTYEHALSLDASNAWTWMNCANMLDKLQRDDEALYRRSFHEKGVCPCLRST